MNPGTASFLRLAKHPLQFRFFLLSKLPSAFFSGVRVREIDETHCVATVPYKWFSKNPFRSTYFACLAMAGELSTGALAMAHLYQLKPPVSMLVVSMEAVYHKKATSRTRFTCEDGLLIRSAVEKALETGEAQPLRTKSTGVSEKGELIAEFFITWSFKKKITAPSVS